MIIAVLPALSPFTLPPTDGPNQSQYWVDRSDQSLRPPCPAELIEASDGSAIAAIGPGVAVLLDHAARPRPVAISTMFFGTNSSAVGQQQRLAGLKHNVGLGGVHQERTAKIGHHRRAGSQDEPPAGQQQTGDHFEQAEYRTNQNSSCGRPRC